MPDLPNLYPVCLRSTNGSKRYVLPMKFISSVSPVHARTFRRCRTVEFVCTNTFRPSMPTDPPPILRQRGSPSSNNPCFRISILGSVERILLSESRKNVLSRRMQRHMRLSKQTPFAPALGSAFNAWIAPQQRPRQSLHCRGL